MTKCTTAYAACLVPFLLALAGFSAAQVATGIPKFGSFGGGPFDVVNLGNLNTHFSVPIVHKAGRGTPFTYDLNYDSSIYVPVGVTGHQTWQPVTNVAGVASYWGWQALESTPYVSYTASTYQGTCDSYRHYTTWTESNFVYHDLGGAHPFPANGSSTLSSCLTTPKSSCINPVCTQSLYASDGSGYLINVTYAEGGLGASSLTNTSGTVFNVSFLSSGTSTTYTSTDANGNQIKYNSGTYTDTLGSNVLTISGSAPNPMKFTYAGPTGSQYYQVNYVTKNIKTNFGCSGVAEYNGSNVSLVSSVVLPDGSQYTFAYEATPNYSGYTTGRISQVTLPTGGTISYNYTYTGSNDGINCSDGSALVLERELTPGGTWQYSRSGADPAWTTTVTDPAGNDTAINFEKDAATVSPTYNFYETQRLTYQGTTSGTLLSTNITCYNAQGGTVSPTNCPTAGVTSPITRVTQFRYVPDKNGIQGETDTLMYTGTSGSLVAAVAEYDYGKAAVGALLRNTSTDYIAVGNGITRPFSTTVADGSGATKAFTSYSYDETALATPSGTTPNWVSVSGGRGNLTTVSVQTNSSTYLHRHYTYYNTGMLATSTDVSTSNTTNGATTTYNYDNTGSPSRSCGNAFMTSIAEPVNSMTQSFTWDCNGGVMLSATDENGQTTSTAYNGTGNYFWRPSSTTDQELNTTDYFYYLTTATPPVEFQTEAKSAAAFNGGHSITDLVATTDGFGRTIFSQVAQSPSPSSYDTVATCYDAFGRVSLTTLPYSAALATSTATCPSTNAGTAYTYDALSRMATITQNTGTGGGVATYTYAENDALQVISPPSSGENNKQKQFEYDGLGRLKSVCEITSGTTSWPNGSCSQNTSASGYLTGYTYDTLNDLTTVTQNAQSSTNQQSRTYAYDMLSRLTSETNPETNNVAATYVYDTDTTCTAGVQAGNLVKRKDAMGNVICTAYDALHRPTSITYPSGTYSTTTDSKYYVYDSATVGGATMQNVAARLAEAYTCPPTGSCTPAKTDEGFSYSVRGELTDTYEHTPNSPSTYYHVTAGYFPNGALETLSNLSGLPTQTYNVDGEGRPYQVSASGQNPVSSVSYNPASQVTALTFGSSDNDAYTYDPNTGRMTQYQFNMGTGPLTDTGALTWNPNGTLGTLQITDQITTGNNQTCNFSHDDLVRIASVNCMQGSTTLWGQTFSNDPFGNLTKSGSITWQPGYTASTNQYSPSSGATYDANGNLTNDTFNTYAWDAEANPVTMAGIGYTYDALDRVVEKNSATQTVYGPTGKLALMSGGTLSKAFVPLPAGDEAVYTANGLAYYRHKDWRGSSPLATTPSRTMYSDVNYAPYGESYPTGAADLNFTGDNQDMLAGLYDTDNRELHPNQGRWISPDPAGLGAADPTNPQSWNRYAYVMNSPLGLIDPSGLDCVHVDEDGGTTVTPGDGDCSGDNNFYFDGTVDPFSVFVDPNGNVVASVNGQLQCAGDGNCSIYNNSSSVTVNGNSAAPPYLLLDLNTQLITLRGRGSTAVAAAPKPPKPIPSSWASTYAAQIGCQNAVVIANWGNMDDDNGKYALPVSLTGALSPIPWVAVTGTVTFSAIVLGTVADAREKCAWVWGQ